MQKNECHDDGALGASVCSLAAGETRSWRIETCPRRGRHLVAARDLAADEVVFAETPLVVAPSMAADEPVLRGELVAVAVALLREPPLGSAARLLQGAHYSADADDDGSLAGAMRAWARDVWVALERRRPPIRRADGGPISLTEESVCWALGVASVNTHGRSDPELRGVLGLLASMMEHGCAPSACVDVASPAEGSVLTLRTRRGVRAGESLSISYVATDAPVNERRRLLRLMHGFVCTCERCAAELWAAAGPRGVDEQGKATGQANVQANAGTAGPPHADRADDLWRRAWEDRVWCGVDPYTGEAAA